MGWGGGEREQNGAEPSRATTLKIEARMKIGFGFCFCRKNGVWFVRSRKLGSLFHGVVRCSEVTALAGVGGGRGGGWGRGGREKGVDHMG